MTHEADRRVWQEIPAPAKAALEAGLAPTDLQTVLLSVARARAAAVTPARLLRRWSEDRFVRPSTHDPRRLSQLQSTMWSMVPSYFVGVELSPVAPLGTVAALGPVDQNRVVSTVRGTEVLSDPTNALAVEAATRRRAGAPRVDLAACHRVLRAQPVPPGANYAPHFPLFALVSSTRDRGSGLAEADLIIAHLRVWHAVLAALVPGAWMSITVFDHPVIGQRLDDTILPALPELRVAPDRTQGAGYYAGAAVGLHTTVDGATLDLGDGGLVTWTAQLMGDRKERCLTSCVAVERLLATLAE